MEEDYVISKEEPGDVQGQVRLIGERDRCRGGNDLLGEGGTADAVAEAEDVYVSKIRQQHGQIALCMGLYDRLVPKVAQINLA